MTRAFRCLKCQTVVASEHCHDLVFCKCRDIGVDGGRVYPRLLFKKGAKFEEVK